MLRVLQLSTDHSLCHEEELRRLQDLGLDVDELQQVGKIGNHSYTRTIGDYHIKGNYKSVKILRSVK